MRTRSRRCAWMRGGFTLAEIAVTIVIVGIGLVLVLQGLNTAKISAAQTRYMKLSRELGLMTLGQVESGLFQDDISNGLAGSYAEQGYDMITYEVAVGDTTFHEKVENGAFDSWAPKSTSSSDPDKKKDDEVTEQPYEKVKIRVTYPKFDKYSNELVLERWMPWKQVYGDTQDNAKKDPAAAKPTTSSPSSSSGSSGSSSTPTAGGK